MAAIVYKIYPINFESFKFLNEFKCLLGKNQRRRRQKKKEDTRRHKKKEDTRRVKDSCEILIVHSIYSVYSILKILKKIF